MFAIIPQEILQCEIVPLLDNISLLCLRIALGTDKLSNRISQLLQEQIMKYTISFVEYFIANGRVKTTMVCLLATQADNLEVLQWGIAHHYLCNQSVSLAACKYGSLSCLQYLIEGKFPYNNNLSKTAARHGHVDCLQYLLKRKLIRGNTMLEAIRSKQLSCVQYVYDVMENVMEDRLYIETAINYNDIVIFEFLWQHGFTRPDNTMNMAALRGNIQILQYLRLQELPWPDDICTWAVLNMNVACLKYICEHGALIDNDIIITAGKIGHLNHLMYLHQKGIPVTSDVMAKIIAGGHTSCIDYLLEQGYNNYDERVIAAAARYSPSYLQLLHERGYPWNESVYYEAVVGENISCLKYAYKHKCPLSKQLLLSLMEFETSDECTQYLIDLYHK